jgi:hypothetical protein
MHVMSNLGKWMLMFIWCEQNKQNKNKKTNNTIGSYTMNEQNQFTLIMKQNNIIK